MTQVTASSPTSVIGIGIDTARYGHRVTFLRDDKQPAAEQLFEVISSVYERQSLIVTTNHPFEQWTEVLGSERLTGAVLDRLTHRCHIVAILPPPGVEAIILVCSHAPE